VPPEKIAGAATSVNTAAPNQMAAFMMPMNRMITITASRYEKPLACAKRETSERRIGG
jgi:hypothetical protein